jgi:hypothetical protein
MRQNLNEECKCAGKCKCKAKKITKFMKDMKEQTQPLKGYECELDKVLLEQLDSSCLNKKALIQYINESNTLSYSKGMLRIASNKNLKEGYELEIVSSAAIIPLKIEDITNLKFIENNVIHEYTQMEELQERSLSSAEKNKKEKIVMSMKGRMKDLLNRFGSKNKAMSYIYGAATAAAKKSVNEEIVNAKHAGTMTKKEIKSRDKIAKKVKAKPIKGKDTEENAKYRLATFIELRKRGQEPKGKAPKKGKKKKKKDQGK